MHPVGFSPAQLVGVFAAYAVARKLWRSKMGDKKRGGKCPKGAGAGSGHTGRGPAGRCRACYAAAAAVPPLGPYSHVTSGRTVRATAAALRRGELHLYAVVAFLDAHEPSFYIQSSPAWACYNGARMVLPGPRSGGGLAFRGDAPASVLRLKNWHHFDDPGETQPRAPGGLIGFVLDVAEGLDVAGLYPPGEATYHFDMTDLDSGYDNPRGLLTVGSGENGVETAVCAVKTDSGTVEVGLHLYRGGDVDVTWDGPASCRPLRHGKNGWWSEHDSPGQERQASACASFDTYGEAGGMKPFGCAAGALDVWFGPLGHMGRVLDAWVTACATGNGFSFAASFVQFEYMGDLTHAQAGPDFAFDPYQYHRDRMVELEVEPRVAVAELLQNLPRERRVIEIQDPASLAELMCADEPTFGQRMTATDKCPVCGRLDCVYWECWK